MRSEQKVGEATKQKQKKENGEEKAKMRKTPQWERDVLFLACF